MLRQGVDILKDAYIHNLMTVMGLVWGIRQILRVRHGGLCFFALPCQSFGFLSSPLHARSADDPWGSRKWSFVLQGNLLAARTSLLWLLAAARSCAVLLENPGRSKVVEIPFIQHIVSFPDLMNNQIKWPGPLFSSELGCLSGLWDIMATGARSQRLALETRALSLCFLALSA